MLAGNEKAKEAMIRLADWTGETIKNLDDRQMERIAPQACLVQAKTYQGGGKWYTLDIDYSKVAEILRKTRYQGWVSLEAFDFSYGGDRIASETIEYLKRREAEADL
mgnify:CR=1 FL=1